MNWNEWSRDPSIVGLLAAVKNSLVAADVAGSALPMQSSTNLRPDVWHQTIVNELSLVPNDAQLELLIQDRLTVNNTKNDLRPFQREVADRAALQCQLRLKASKEMSLSRIPSCTAVLFRSTAWASQQKSRVDAIQIPRGIEKTLRVFEQAIKQLPPRVITTVAPKDKVKAIKTKATKKKPLAIPADAIAKAPEHFWSDSIVRPMVADNLALGQP